MRPRIIVVDDEEIVRDLLVGYFAELGYEVISCPEPIVCPVYSRGECPCGPGEVCGDVMITDYLMPRMNGIEFIEAQIRAGCKGIARNKAVMSASLDDGEAERLRELGCRFFRKPFSLVEMEAWVKEAVQNVDPERRLRDL